MSQSVECLPYSMGTLVQRRGSHQKKKKVKHDGMLITPGVEAEEFPRLPRQTDSLPSSPGFREIIFQRMKEMGRQPKSDLLI